MNEKEYEIKEISKEELEILDNNLSIEEEEIELL